MVASSCNVAEPNTVLNAMMAEAFSDAADAIEAKLREGKHTDVAIREVTAEFIRENKDIYLTETDILMSGLQRPKDVVFQM